MNLEENRKKILEDDEFVLSEFEKIQVLFEMKKVIRYHHTREEVIDTESVAEHVYGMQCLTSYFLPLEDSKNQADKEKINLITIFHDVDEIETGDKIGYLKTQADRENERIAQDIVLKQLPQRMQDYLPELLDEYDERKTFEAKFVKAIDKIEPVFHLFNENGKKIFHTNKTTEDNHRSIKDKYMLDFPYIARFNNVIRNVMRAEKYYYEG